MPPAIHILHHPLQYYIIVYIDDDHVMMMMMMALGPRVPVDLGLWTIANLICQLLVNNLPVVVNKLL